MKNVSKKQRILNNHKITLIIHGVGCCSLPRNDLPIWYGEVVKTIWVEIINLRCTWDVKVNVTYIAYTLKFNSLTKLLIKETVWLLEVHMISGPRKFRTLSNIYDEAFLKMFSSFLPLITFRKKIHHRYLTGS